MVSGMGTIDPLRCDIKSETSQGKQRFPRTVSPPKPGDGPIYTYSNPQALFPHSVTKFHPQAPTSGHWLCDKSGLTLAGERDETPGGRRQGQRPACPNSLGHMGPLDKMHTQNQASSSPTLVVPAGMQRAGEMWLEDGTWWRG